MKRTGSGIWIILLLVLGVASVLRIYQLGSQCFWVDELLTMQDLNGRGHEDLYLPRNVLMEHPPSLTDPKNAASWWKIWNGLAQESHPPFYFILCRWWRDLCGTSESAIRSLSVIFSLLGIALLFFLVRELTGGWAGIWSAVLMALSVPQIAYAQEARDYSMLVAVSLLAAWALVRIEKRGLTVVRWIGLTLALLAMAMTHYFSFGVLVSLLAYAVLVLRGDRVCSEGMGEKAPTPTLPRITRGWDKKHFRCGARWQVVGAFASAAVLFVMVWGRNLLAQQQMLLHDFPMYANPQGHTQATFVRAIATPLRQLIGANLGMAVSIFAGAVLLGMAAMTVVYRRRDLLLWRLWLIGAIGTIAVIDLRRTAEQLTMVKYTFEAGPAVCAIAAGWLPGKFRGWRYVLPALLVGLELYFLPGAYVDWKGDWRGAAETVVALTPPDDPVVIAGNGTGRPTLSWLYLGMNVYVNPWPRALAISDKEPSAKMMEQLRKYSRVTLVTDCVSAQPGEIVKGFAPVGRPRYFPNIGVVWSMVKR